jgi:tryptophan synthase alpha chain
MTLESYIRKRLEKKDILLMTHTVLGYPSMKESFNIIETMAAAGVDLIELQIPFSEPMADGPVILRANQEALKRGAGVEGCLEVAEKAARSFPIPFLLMTYYNIPFCYGVDAFVASMAERGLRGAIIPDLPVEEGHDYLKAMQRQNLSPVLMFSPTTSTMRMEQISSFGQGFIYCVARKGVTGAETALSDDLSFYLGRCRKATSLPLAVGFGIKDRQDVDFLKGKADIAVIGTRTIRLMEEEGSASVGEFLRGLQAEKY